jgi:hypothetical protein
MIVDEKGQYVGYFIVENLDKYYKIPNPKVYQINPFLDYFYDKQDVG